MAEENDQQPMQAQHPDSCDKWTEIEHLPEWDEEYYDVYTAKKYGKWVMLKTLKPEYRDKPDFQAMIEKEFEVRYNLAGPHIVMINDYEYVPGVGMSIITDDVYGDSLRKLINEKRVTAQQIDKLKHQLVDAMEYIQNNHLVHHPIRPEAIIFTENIGNLKLIDVGFDQKSRLSHGDTSRDIYDYGVTLTEALNACSDEFPQLRRVAKKCTNPDPAKRYRTAQDIHLAIENRQSHNLMIWLAAFLVAMIAILWITSHYHHKSDTQDTVERIIDQTDGALPAEGLPL